MSLFIVSVDGYSYAEIQWGETIQRFAARVLGDAARWTDVADLNSLRAPYIAETSSDCVAAYGDAILVPAPSAVSSAAVSPEDVYETDVELRGGRLVIEDGDFAVISGTPNLKQALTHRITVDQGDLMYHQSYGSGIRRLLGVANGPAAGLLAARYAKEAVISDPRIEKINGAKADVSGDTMRVDVEAQPVSGKAIQLSAEV